MTPRETLEKYGLKTDVKSIRERIFNIGDFGESSNAIYKAQLISANGFYSIKLLAECHSADLSLLCERAEKGERAVEIVVAKRQALAKTYSIVCETESQKALAKTVDNVLEEIIEELEGEPK